MNQNSRRLGTLAVALVSAASALPAAGAGMIYISTRYQQDTGFGTEFVTDEKGPGMVSPGDVAMGSLLADHGYSFRLLLDRLLGPQASTVGQDPTVFTQPANAALKPVLAIMSGSGASADTPPPPAGVPIMMGEHVCLGNNSGRAGSLYMYKGTASNDPNDATAPAVSKYMKVVAPDHPIMKGIPLDADGRVKIFRDKYPDENAHLPDGGKSNYEWRWCTQVVADAAPGTTVLGTLDGDDTRSCFAVAEVGGMLANDQKTDVRLVHMFMNENGSGGSRRVFLALTDLGRVLFLRAAQWAMGETLEPYKSFRVLDVTPAGAGAVQMSWEGSPHQNYRVLASADLSSWSTVVQDVAGLDGTVKRKFDVSGAPSSLFFQIRSVP